MDLDNMAGASAELARCRVLANTFKRWIVERSHAANVGHIGSALSISDIVAVLWELVMKNPGTQLPDRDRFILCKGHAALALYCALRAKGLIDEKAFETYCGEGSALGVHPEHSLKGVDLSTGSLGQGLSVACGLAFGLSKRSSPAHVYALLSDAECNEGQVWEAAMFAAHHQLSNLTAVIDLNGLQALGNTREIINLSMSRIWTAHGWEVVDVDGHDISSLCTAFRKPAGHGPRVVVARTALGCGVSFMRGKLEWHYRNLTPELAVAALDELAAFAEQKEQK